MPDFEKMSFDGQTQGVENSENTSPENGEAKDKSSKQEKGLTKKGEIADAFMVRAIDDFIVNPNGDRIEDNKG
jgi:hypothetical protein